MGPSGVRDLDDVEHPPVHPNLTTDTTSMPFTPVQAAINALRSLNCNPGPGEVLAVSDVAWTSLDHHEQFLQWRLPTQSLP